MIQPSRVRTLVDRPARRDADYVLYWMQQSQRAGSNPALEYAVDRANAMNLPVLVAFALTGYPEAPARAYAFLAQGLVDVREALEARGIGFVARYGAWDPVITGLAGGAALVVCDRGYLRIQREWREGLAAALDVEVVQIEVDVVVPVETASPKHEFAARTLRPKLHRLWDEYLVPHAPVRVRRAMKQAPAGDVDLEDHEGIFRRLKLDTRVGPVRRFRGGEKEARRHLARFLEVGLGRYADERGRPEAGAASHMSPYLHFGQISPVEIALAVGEAQRGSPEDRIAYLEELIVRRELAMNHAFYEPAYDRYEGLPAWARRALAKAATDRRPHLYTREIFEQGRTHDRYWNAAMKEMRTTGYMHNHLRMYWGKKILEWSAGPEEAFETVLSLNNRYFLDGRDANSFTNVGWLFGLHDRPWGAQPVFGTVRSMGLNTFKKFDAEAYVRDVDALARAEG